MASIYNLITIRKEARAAGMLLPAANGADPDAVEFEIQASSDDDAEQKAREIVSQYKLEYWELVKVETRAVAGCELYMMQ